MLKGGFTCSYQPDLLDVKHHMVYAHVGDFQAKTQADERIAVPDDLEYIFQLIQSHFLCVVPLEGCYPPIEQDGMNIHLYSLGLLSLPFQSDTDKSEIGLWNDLVKQVSGEFGERMKSALRGKCSEKQLYELVQNCIEDFEYEDRERLDVDKLANLAAFVYDFCMLTLKEAHLYRNLDLYMDGKVNIRDKEFVAPLRRCAEIRQYCINGDNIGDTMRIYYGPDFNLPTVQLSAFVQNPHANDSYISAMFVDLMHKFFLSFGLKKFGRSEWSAPERWLIYELLRLFGLCKSTKPPKESKYVTTVIKEYGAYFSKCNLRTWIREKQAYCYLVCCTPEQFTEREQVINEPFLPLDNYFEVMETAPSEAPTASGTVIKPEDLPEELRDLLSELSGNSYKVAQAITHKTFGPIAYLSAQKKEYSNEVQVKWDPRLDYVMMLIDSAFECISFITQISQYLITRQDLHNPNTRARLISSLERDLLGRLTVIPRGLFSQEEAMSRIQFFKKNCRTRDDRDKVDVEKLYVLFLFIFDYVFFTYKESVVHMHLRNFIKTGITVCGIPYSSTMFCDDLLSDHLEHLFFYVRGENDKDVFEQLQSTALDGGSKIQPIPHPNCSVKNMTAMFFDLFARFFKSFGLSKRSTVKLVSDQESILIGDLAHLCGICSSDKQGTARAMYLTNQDYFQKSSLEIAIRGNEYGYLLLNTMSEELFGPKTRADE